MNYKKAIKLIETTDNKAQYFAVNYNEADNHFYIYTISDDDDENEEGLYISCKVEGGILFNFDGVEDFLTIEEATPQISNLNFKVLDKSLDIFGAVTEHVLFKLFPTLPNPENIASKPEQLHFFKLAKKYVMDELK